jgi:hypothetical protein
VARRPVDFAAARGQVVSGPSFATGLGTPLSGLSSPPLAPLQRTTEWPGALGRGGEHTPLGMDAPAVQGRRRPSQQVLAAMARDKMEGRVGIIFQCEGLGRRRPRTLHQEGKLP